MSSPSITDESTYPTRRTDPYDSNPFNAQPISSHRLELGPPQRRRVNPESLAARLGPELVAEMEKHIIPGSIEMPPFSVRRDIQIKFGIDRRHIYDFFHSRGLRCLNEKTMRNSYLEIKSQRPARSIVPPGPAAFPEPRKRRAAAAALEATSASLKRSHTPRKQKGRQKRLERTPSPARHESTTSTPREASESFHLEPEPEVNSQVANMAQESLSSESSDAPFLLSDDGCTHFLGQFSTFSPEEAEESDLSSCFSVSSLLDLNTSVSTPTLSTSPSTSSTLSLASEIPDSRPKVLPLTSQERKAHYAWIDKIIGPASGIQESMGTYKAFMEHQREVYYDRVLLIAEQPTKEAVRRRAKNEFMSWLGGTSTCGIAAHELPPSIMTAPRVDAGLTRRTIRFSSSACWSSPGPSLSGRTDVDICGYSRNQGVMAALSVPQLNSRLGYPITRHSRRRTFSATVDM